MALPPTMRPVSLSFFQDWTRLVRMYLSQGSPRRSYRQWMSTQPSSILASPMQPSRSRSALSALATPSRSVMRTI